MKHVFLLVGARPNFIKVAPLHRALEVRGIRVTLVHTGQHYDKNMSDVIFRDLGIPDPHVNLGVGSGERVTQTKKIIDALIPHLSEHRPEALVVFGDVTSTAAGALAGVHVGIPVIHVEAGLRSFNWRMPEELNRMIADHHSAHLFTSETRAADQLRSESIPAERIHFVGNIMIDSLRHAEPRAETSQIFSQLGLVQRGYALVTIHRPENVDEVSALKETFQILQRVSEHLPIVFPVHPRTKVKIDAAGIVVDANIRIVEPVGYIDMIALTKNARFVMTDSGGLQEETTALGIPCLTVREQTERPSTVELGTSEIVGRDEELILRSVRRILDGQWKKGELPPLWDGHTAERIADILLGL